MKSNTLAYVLGAIAAGITLCVCTISAGVAGYFFFQDDIQSILAEAPFQFEDTAQSPLLITETAQPQTVLGGEVDLSELFVPVWESRQYLQDDFVEQPVDDTVLAQGALDGLNSYLDAQGLALEDLPVSESAPSAADLAAEASTPEEAMDAFSPFWDAWQLIQYSDTTVSGTYEELMQSALRGMVDALGDPHTSYMDPNQLRQTNISLEGEYEGIGAFVDTTTEYVTITSPMEGSPAERAGLMPGDQVIAVDGQDMTGVPGDVVLSHILGPAGSTVILTIQREGEEPFDVEIVRERINVPSVVGEMLEGDIAYVELNTFGSNTGDELRDELETLLDDGAKGLILDLRNNGGGFLSTAVEVTSEFINDGVVLYEEYGDGTRDTYNAFDDGVATQIPMVVLVNNGTASASEILAGAIQDYERGVLVGETTYGKGSVQQPVTLSNGQGALRITVAHWYTPDERLIHGIGLTPDYEVPLTQEDFDQGLDPQLDKALEVILAEVS